ncbi:hypothetical protein GCM10011374_30450 [Kocuria dechangensis]|uniref:DNA-binding protein n=1 Tax=Kocuria dechangensis TaxID=1176249 RepID=A0A917H1M8_9MICC|nr:hypothetical protein [Kocuria dechangensis]GGG64679.1 hypothetical protein GCM10011374_30450 [Kocuria dechangensis]
MSAPRFEHTPDQEAIDSPAVTAALEQLSEAMGVPLTLEILRRAAAEAQGIKALGTAMAAAPQPISPELARSLQAQENWWRTIEADHQMLSSAEVAELVGKTSHRSYASRRRQKGRLLGYRRGSSYLYPTFQFDLSTRTVLPVIEDLLATSRGYGVPDEDLVMWLCTPSAYFEEQDEPVNHLHHPDGVLAAARDEFGAVW